MSDHVDVMRALVEIDYQGPIRPDHVPLMEGEEGHDVGEKAQGYFSGKASGYTMMGRLYAIGYLRGLVESAKKHHSVAGAKPAGEIAKLVKRGEIRESMYGFAQK